jgi:hypothetical protein
MLVNILIIFFCFLIIFQIFLANFGNSVIEGLENKPSNTVSSDQQYQSYPEDPLILSKQNAANIDFLKGRVDEVMGLKQEVTDISLNLASIQLQVNTILEQQQEYSKSINNGEPIETTGADTSEPEASIEESFTNINNFARVDNNAFNSILNIK